MSRPSSGRRCEIDGCSRPHKGRGMCSMHIKRVARTGSTDAPPPRGTPYKRSVTPAHPRNTTECRNGHPWTGEHFVCPTCRRKSSARYDRDNAWRRAEQRARRAAKIKNFAETVDAAGQRR